MRVALICSSADPGRDGVGDYTVRLGSALAAAGHGVLVIAERDFALRAFNPLSGVREGVRVLRLPASLSNDQRAYALAAALKEFAPDWVILQFVCWGFANHGVLDPPLSALIATISRWPVAVYCHELWLGLERGTSLRHRIWGWRQRRTILRFLKQLRPVLVMTSNAVYSRVLQQFGWDTRIVPLFSNIPVRAEGGERFVSLLRERTGEALWGSRNEVVIATVFGSVDPKWKPQAALNWIGAEAQRRGRRVLLVIAGRRSARDEALVEHLTREVDLTTVMLGAVPADIASGLLQEADIGLPSSDWLRLGKSGVAAAMMAHGLPMLVVRNCVSYRDVPDLTLTHAPSVFRFDAGDPPDFDRLLAARTRAADSLPEVTRQLVGALQNAH